MRLPDKTTTLEEAIARIADGATVMVGGFGVPGTPFTLIRELVRQGPRDLTVIKNDANETGMGVDHLLASGQVARLITTHIGLNPRAIELMNAGQIEVEFNAAGHPRRAHPRGRRGARRHPHRYRRRHRAGRGQTARRDRRQAASSSKPRCAPTWR